MTPFAKALLAFHRGDSSARFVITREDGFAQDVPVSTFFADDEFSYLESRALASCRGDVLDVGAGAGRHSLALRRLGHEVTSIELEPECEVILRSRGLEEIIIGDIMSWNNQRFDTVLMLMNGIGMIGTPAKLDQFLSTLPSLLKPDGFLLCDSIDVGLSDNPTHVAYREANVKAGRAPGQQSFRISFEGESGQSFEWLHLSPEALALHCAKMGLTATVLHQASNGHYLACVGL